ncbi:MAG: glycosyltransferase, partial [Verrucomicrobia bacterium]|nr:glycosyltransferase [Verrucomicrobiota bacterium]
MNVLIVNNMAPFVRGGAEALACHLSARLNATSGVQAEILRVPFSWEPFEHLANEIFLNRTLQLPNVDRVIALKFPAYLIPHDLKILWLLHQFRQAYDLRDRGQSNIPDTPRGEKIMELVRRADAQAFSKCRRIFTISRVTQERLKRYNAFDSEVLITPMNHPEMFVNRGDNGYIFAGGRINSSKRQYLLVEAMALTNSSARLIVAGPPDTPGDADRLRDTVERLKLEDRVVLDFGFHPVEKIADYVNRARACAYLPVDEDGVGYVTIEAVSASKPVITLSDSGGILQLVVDNETGYVVEPDVKALADALDSIWSDPGNSKRMGKA